MNGSSNILRPNLDVDLKLFSFLSQSDLMNMSMMELIHAEDRHILMKNISIDNTVSAESPSNHSSTSSSSSTGDPHQQHAPSYTKFDIDPDLFQSKKTTLQLCLLLMCFLGDFSF